MGIVDYPSDDPAGETSSGSHAGAFPVLLPGWLGSVGYGDRAMFDDKLTTEADFKFDGANNGLALKTKNRALHGL